jgi:hypothetical protein
VLAEIEFAYLLLLVDRFSRVDYECYGTKKQNPDFTVTDDKTGIVFNMEVKRIRRTDIENRFELWKQDVAQQIRSVPSELAFSMDVEGVNISEKIDELEVRKAEIVDFIKSTIAKAETKIPTESQAEYSIPGFDGLLIRFELRKPILKTSPNTSYYGGSFSIPVTHKEYRKFGDEICDPEHLGQMRSGMVNILAISTDSGTHDDFNLGKALASLKTLAGQENNKFFVGKGFAGVADFTKQFQELSGILFRSTWVQVAYASNALWNNDVAKCPIPRDIGEILKGIDYPKPRFLLTTEAD